MKAYSLRNAIFLTFVLASVLICASYILSFRQQPQSACHSDVIQTRATRSYYATPYNEKSVPFTDLSQSADLIGEVFWRSHKPSYQCPPSLFSIVGDKKKDGSKWMCGLKTFARATMEEGYNCTFYSFGVNKDSSFEAEVLATTHCHVYAYDPTVDSIASPLKPDNMRVHFFKMGISDKNGIQELGKGKVEIKTKTLKTLMDENGHTFIDILKIDVEGFEFQSLERMFADFEELPFGQLLIEFHQPAWKPFNKSKVVIDFIRRLENGGSRVFSVEPNERAIKCCSEFSFINLKYRLLWIPE